MNRTMYAMKYFETNNLARSIMRETKPENSNQNSAHTANSGDTASKSPEPFLRVHSRILQKERDIITLTTSNPDG